VPKGSPVLGSFGEDEELADVAIVPETYLHCVKIGSVLNLLWLLKVT
jgi:hypothetical protein